MSPSSTDKIVGPGSTIVIAKVLHTAGSTCCIQWSCSWCGNRAHFQTKSDSRGVVIDVIEACESCDYDDWTRL